MLDLNTTRIGIIGLGYVGLPLAVEFGKHVETIGFDINPARIAELQAGQDRTREVEPHELTEATRLTYTADPDALATCNTFIVTVPTPIDQNKRPDLRPLIAASQLVGGQLSPGDVVIYESTVYPGTTEEVCVPILEAVSGMTFNEGFFAGYSPERINPGDKLHRLPTITKVTSGSTEAVADYVTALYDLVITAGTHRAPSIKVAEAAKVIENTQRDVNIALINELSLIFERLELDTQAVLEAAGTKWNFLKFWPGLVGGHCIGVDPYYLTFKAQEVGYNPEIILAGRRINDNMGAVVATRVVKLMSRRGLALPGSRVLVLGLTFKENCPDLRNTRVVDIVAELRDFQAAVDVHDPLADPQEALHEYGIELTQTPQAGAYDAIVLAVAHQDYREAGIEALRQYGKPGAVVFDVKYLFPADVTDGRL